MTDSTPDTTVDTTPDTPTDTALPAVDDAGVPVHAETCEDCSTLYAANRTFWCAQQPALVELFEQWDPTPEAAGLAWMDDGAINVRLGEYWLYEPNARAFADKQVNTYPKNPARLLFGKPAVTPPEEPPEFPTDAADEINLTRKYDDRAEDFHFSRFMVEIAQAFQAAEGTIEKKVVQKQPYYLAIYGLGLGYHLLPLITHYRPELVILIDSSTEALRRASFTTNWQFVHDWCEREDIKLKMLFEGNPHELVRKVGGIVTGESLLGLDGMLSLLHINDPVLKVAFNEFQSPKTANLASFIGFIVDEYNMMKNSFRNLRSGTKRMLRGARVKAQLPLLIVGSGPSLEDNIEQVRRLRERVILITTGSNLRILLKNDIRPDFHCNLERAHSILVRHEELVADGYAEAMKEVYAVMTSTIWPGIDTFFKDAIYFLRPALSPVGAFCEDGSQILNNEGPQVTNTAVAFAKRLEAKDIYLLGVDLGSPYPKRPRAESAWTPIRPRKLNIPVRGNFGRTVFTDMPLTQQRETLQEQIKRMNQLGRTVYNLSNGARIEGAIARRPENVDLPEPPLDRVEHVRELAEQFPVYTRERFLASWLSAQVRDNVAQLIEGLIRDIEHSPTWDFKLVKQLEDKCAYVNKALREQYAPRLIRGSVLRMFMHLHSILLRLPDAEEQTRLFEALRPVVVDHLRTIECEAYSLVDELESEDDAFAPNYG